jgi:uncharacterized protein YjiS (DUF1127 family)
MRFAMTILQIERSRISHGSWIGASLAGRVERILRALRPERRHVPWSMLNDHMLRDIGISEAEAEIERLRASGRVPEWTQACRRFLG